MGEEVVAHRGAKGGGQARAEELRGDRDDPREDAHAHEQRAVGEHVAGVARGDADVDDLGHHERDEELQQRLEHLEERCQHALGVVARKVAPELEHATSAAGADNPSILARVRPEVLLGRLTRSKP